MFTGIIEEIGLIKKIIRTGSSLKLSVSCNYVLSDLKIGDSINVNGVCQTVVNIKSKIFDVEAIEETLKKTNFSRLKIGEKVNLERALTLNSRLGGHFVLGHIDTTGEIIKSKNLTGNLVLTISYPKEFSKYLIHVGSISLNGISLTIAEYNDKSFMVAIIPHTLKSTNLMYQKSGDLVNIEFDVLGKYAINKLNNEKKGTITLDWLNDMGF